MSLLPTTGVCSDEDDDTAATSHHSRCILHYRSSLVALRILDARLVYGLITKHPPDPPMTLGNMRELSAQNLLAY
jgi:hypothetical protein